MMRNERPIAVTILAGVYIAIGLIGFAYHVTELQAGGAFDYEAFWIELVRISALVCGAFLLRGHNWARWLALAWISLHVIISAFDSISQFAIHCLFCGVIGWVLFRPDSTHYFRRPKTNGRKII